MSGSRAGLSCRCVPDRLTVRGPRASAVSWLRASGIATCRSSLRCRYSSPARVAEWPIRSISSQSPAPASAANALRVWRRAAGLSGSSVPPALRRHVGARAIRPPQPAENCKQHESPVAPSDRLGICRTVRTGRSGDFSTDAPLIRHGLGRIKPSSAAVFMTALSSRMPSRP
jgi:hypothetical protein